MKTIKAEGEWLNLAAKFIAIPHTPVKGQNSDSHLLHAVLQSASKLVFSARNVLLLFVFSIALVTSGCLSTKAYVDPQFRRATFTDVKPSDNPKPVLVEASFQVNGKDRPSVNQLVFSRAMKVLRAAKVFADGNTNRQAIAHLKIVVNNIGDLGGAAGKGVGTGLTLGLAGSEVVDNYEMTVVYTPAAGSPITKIYKHALHTTIGVHSAPPNLEPVPRELAFDQVMQDMLLNFLSDLQKEGAL